MERTEQQGRAGSASRPRQAVRQQSLFLRLTRRTADAARQALRDPEPLITNELEVSVHEKGLPTGTDQAKHSRSQKGGSHLR